MIKLSKAQEKVLRQVAAGEVRLVYVGDNDHSIRVWDAIGKGGHRVNRQYDALHKAHLVETSLDNDVVWTRRKTLLTNHGENTLAALGLPGTFVFQDIQRGTSVVWMIRKGEGELRAYVLYKDGQVYDTYSRPESVYTVFRSFCPYVYNFEGDMGL